MVEFPTVERCLELTVDVFNSRGVMITGATREKSKNQFSTGGTVGHEIIRSDWIGQRAMRHVQSDNILDESVFLWLNGANKALWTISSLLGPAAVFSVRLSTVPRTLRFELVSE